MKLKIIDSKAARKGLVKISFSKAGSISISGSAAEKYGLKSGDSIHILQDEDSPKDFYLVKRDNANGVILRANSTGTSLVAGYTSACDAIRNQFGINEKETFSVGLGGQIKTEFGSAVALITAGLKKS